VTNFCCRDFKLPHCDVCSFLVSELVDVSRFKGFSSYITAFKYWSRGSFVSIVNWLRNRRTGYDSLQGEKRLIHHSIEMLWGPLSLVSSGQREIFPQVKATKPWLSIQTSYVLFLGERMRYSIFFFFFLHPIFVCSSKIIVAEMLHVRVT
jgi:hypothetical protein